jgi:peptidyl-prolyl cis-trans isomerase C
LLRFARNDRLIIIAVLVCLLFLRFAGKAYSEEKVVAEVGKEKITLKDYQEQVLQYEKSKSFQQKLQSLTPAGKKKILDGMVTDSLFYQAAMEKGLTLNEETLKEIELLKRRLLIRKYIEQALKEKPIEEAELRDYYEKNSERFVIPEKRKLSHIVVKTEQEAQKLLAEVKEGKDFGLLAEQNNTDATKKKKGDLGWVKKGAMVKEFEDAAFQLKKDEMSGIVKTRFGYHIIRMEDIKAQEQKKFEDVKADIRKKLEQQRIQELGSQLKDTYGVKVNEELIPGGGQ